MYSAGKQESIDFVGEGKAVVSKYGNRLKNISYSDAKNISNEVFATGTSKVCQVLGVDAPAECEAVSKYNPLNPALYAEAAEVLWGWFSINEKSKPNLIRTKGLSEADVARIYGDYPNALYNLSSLQLDWLDYYVRALHGFYIELGLKSFHPFSREAALTTIAKYNETTTKPGWCGLVWNRKVGWEPYNYYNAAMESVKTKSTELNRIRAARDYWPSALNWFDCIQHAVDKVALEWYNFAIYYHSFKAAEQLKLNQNNTTGFLHSLQVARPQVTGPHPTADEPKKSKVVLGILAVLGGIRVLKGI